MITGNPLLADLRTSTGDGDRMTVAGTTQKIGMFLALTTLTAVVGWSAAGVADGAAGVLALGSVLVAFVLGVLVARRPERARKHGPVYALLEGFVVGVISHMYANKPIFEDKVAGEGVVIAAFVLTVCIAGSLLALCSAGKLRISVGSRIGHGIVAATAGVALFYLVSIAGSMFGMQVPLLWDNSQAGIALSGLLVVLAAANLVMDFSYIYDNVGRADRDMEWFAAFGVLVSLIWLYLEVLRLAVKFATGGLFNDD